VEFSYPPLKPGEGHDSHSLPEEWKYLPFLALPDGAHNYQEDTVFFHLPPRCGDRTTVYGVSCYRQIEAKALKVRQADITRETVQKSVCVLSQLPLYGLLQAKLQLITHAYFEEKDFSQISILKELYDHMNSSLGSTLLEGSQVYLGLSPRDLVLHFRHKVLILFKLILLEKKVLFYISPVNRLVGALMTVLSLFPGKKRNGIIHYPSTPEHKEKISCDTCFFSTSSVRCNTDFICTLVKRMEHVHRNESCDMYRQLRTWELTLGTLNSERFFKTLLVAYTLVKPSFASFLKPYFLKVFHFRLLCSFLPYVSNYPVLCDKVQVLFVSAQYAVSPSGFLLVNKLLGAIEELELVVSIRLQGYGYLCLPYMALQQHHLLSDITVRGFVAGATNILFRQQKHLSDAIVEIEDAHVQIHDPELRKILNPTTADLRFADYLVKHVTENRDDVFLDGTGWEGGDEWIRAQFSAYLHALLAAVLQPDNEKTLSDFGTAFVAAWKNTHNYRVWNSNKHPALAEVNSSHPFQGQYSVSDVKLRLSHSVQNSERGKKIGNVMVSTSRNVVQTGKAVGQSVGGAFTSAKSAMSSWFSTFTQSTQSLGD
ncbi:AVL9 protein, partial [Chordeiles acutipennis]|nr:AVL9 protein [Chordeiles acutipennis]